MVCGPLETDSRCGTSSMVATGAKQTRSQASYACESGTSGQLCRSPWADLATLMYQEGHFRQIDSTQKLACGSTRRVQHYYGEPGIDQRGHKQHHTIANCTLMHAQVHLYCGCNSQHHQTRNNLQLSTILAHLRRSHRQSRKKASKSLHSLLL